MKEEISIYISGQTTEYSVERLKEILSTRHIEIKQENNKLIFIYDHEKSVQKNDRNAGRKPCETIDLFTYSDVKQMIREKGIRCAIETIGVSRATLYRRLKVHAESGRSDSEIF